MQADFRDHPLFRQAQELTEAWLRPGSGQAVSLAQLAVSPDARRAIAAATVCDALEGVLLRDGTTTTRLALVDLGSGDIEILTHGPHSDSSPQWSPKGGSVAYLSDREEAHISRLRIFDLADRDDRATPAVNGFIESLQWSTDAKWILLGVAGFGSDVAGIQGAIALDRDAEEGGPPAWAPMVEGAPEAAPWRSLWVYDLAAHAVRQVTPRGVNVWQGAWCGPHHVVAICSDKPEETDWYSADLRLIEIGTGTIRTIFKPEAQLGRLTASPSGRSVAVVEAICSDRDIVAGDVRLIDVGSGLINQPLTLNADVVQLIWRDEGHLSFVAWNGPDTVVGLLDVASGSSRELWRGRERTISGMIFPEIAPLGTRPGDVLFLCESFLEAPALVALENGEERVIRRFGSPEVNAGVSRLGVARDFIWNAPDGLDIHGWLITPPRPGPHAVIMQVHGGPVFSVPPMYVGRVAFSQMALAAGYALFQPNVRGSSGRGQAFARHVFGDMGGADTYDFLSGLDALVEAGIADPERIGVTGGSYGGFMTAWLITQDQRFAAAVPVAATANWVSDHLTGNIPTFCETFLGDKLSNPAGKYFTRSPIHYVERVKTPTLNVCGARDRITHPAQAVEFHHALQGAGVESVLVTYPQEGHGIRSMPAVFDYAGRMMDWFSRHMPPNSKPKG
jgi:dipeptidyl aminopeptidase/acylaminoacyl peptidase